MDAGASSSSSDERLGVDEALAAGRVQRKTVARRAHADWQPQPGRPDPVDLLCSQDADRLPQLVPIRYGRMLASPFAFLRGAAIVMAYDLAAGPCTGITVQLCGDAHLLNFGLYLSPERTMLFDINDFDETLPGPFEWDLKRLGASLVLAGRERSFDADACRLAALRAAHSYREWMRRFSRMGDLDVWYTKVSTDAIVARVAEIDRKVARRTRVGIDKARRRDSLQALAKLSERVDGRLRIREDPPLLVRLEVDDEEMETVRTLVSAYRRTLEDDRAYLLSGYRFVDAAHKVVGVGSVGTRCVIVLFAGRDEDDPLFLQLKQAGPSVLEAVLPRSIHRNAGHRVVAGQRLMQAASDIFLGWLHGPEGHDFCCRQLRDGKGSIDLDIVRPADLVGYAELCGATLARAHARSRCRAQIAGYLGKSDAFDEALADFAVAYADQSELDHQRLVDTVAAGKVRADTGV